MPDQVRRTLVLVAFRAIALHLVLCPAAPVVQLLEVLHQDIFFFRAVN
tara:strand:- start:316 stop:459 length:144 start_codon:yes stop_codon:yes gene_type:complete